MLTDNGKQFTGRYSKPLPTEVMFERVCRENGINQRLTKPRSPTTTGKIERFHKTLRREARPLRALRRPSRGPDRDRRVGPWLQPPPTPPVAGDGHTGPGLPPTHPPRRHAGDHASRGSRAKAVRTDATAGAPAAEVVRGQPPAPGRGVRGRDQPRPARDAAAGTEPEVQPDPGRPDRHRLGQPPDRPRRHSRGGPSGASEPTAPSSSPGTSSALASRTPARPSPWSSRRPASAFSTARSRFPPTRSRAAPSPATSPLPADRQPSSGTAKHHERHRQASPETELSSISPDRTAGENNTAVDTTPPDRSTGASAERATVGFTVGDRAFLAALLHGLPKDVLRRMRLLVRPDTVLRWHRDLVARRHATRSRPHRGGRPRTVRSIRALVLRLARENPMGISAPARRTVGARTESSRVNRLGDPEGRRHPTRPRAGVEHMGALPTFPRHRPPGLRLLRNRHPVRSPALRIRGDRPRKPPRSHPGRDRASHRALGNADSEEPRHGP